MNKHLHVIVGLGQTGFSCARFLAKQGVPVAVMDSREQAPGAAQLKNEYPDISQHLGGFDRNILAQAGQVIVSPGVSLQQEAIAECIQHNIPVCGDLDLFAKAAKSPIVAITGTNGKTTVTSLLAQMAKCSGKAVKVGGNIGVPVVDLLDGSEPDYYVLEVSSFQLESAHLFRADIATILNIAPDHLDRHASLANYITIKKRIYRKVNQAVINADDHNTKPDDPSINTIAFTSREPHSNEFGLRQQGEQLYLAHGQQSILPVHELQIKGQYNYLNALAALALGESMGLSIDDRRAALCSFSGIEHRCQWIREINGVNWYNDSKGTNVGASVAVITGLAQEVKGNIILIAGGMAKQADFTPLSSVIKQYVHCTVLLGRDAGQIKDTLSKDTCFYQASDLQEAIDIARRHATSGDAVLLSPACASFDMFENYAHRGQVFTQLVSAL